MVWYCEDCKKNVGVLAGFGERQFEENDSKEDMFESFDELEPDLLVRCAECDGTRVVWK